MKRVLALVPARGGSKGVPRKNLRCVGGASLVDRAVRTALGFGASQSGLTLTTFVDTDDLEIADEGRRAGAIVPFLRAPELARDDTSTVDSVLGALDRLEASGGAFDALILLQPTSPLRTTADVAGCWGAFVQAGWSSAITVTAFEHPLVLALRRADDGTLAFVAGPPAVVRRQAHPPAYFPNGAVYVTAVPLLRERRAFVLDGVTVGVPMPRWRSIDVDTEDDLAAAEALLAARSSPSTPKELS